MDSLIWTSFQHYRKCWECGHEAMRLQQATMYYQIDFSKWVSSATIPWWPLTSAISSASFVPIIIIRCQDNPVECYWHKRFPTSVRSSKAASINAVKPFLISIFFQNTKILYRPCHSMEGVVTLAGMHGWSTCLCMAVSIVMKLLVLGQDQNCKIWVVRP